MIADKQIKEWRAEPVLDKRQVQLLLNSHPLIAETKSKKDYHFAKAPDCLVCTLTNTYIHFYTDWTIAHNDWDGTERIFAAGTMSLECNEWRASIIMMMVSSLWKHCCDHDAIIATAAKYMKIAEIKNDAKK